MGSRKLQTISSLPELGK